MSTTCPALILAARRKDKVIGRSKILTVSISTRNGLSQSGAPEGSREAAKYEGELRIEERIKASHMGSPRLNVNKRWLVDLNTYGRSPIKFVIINIMKRGAKRAWEEDRRDLNVRDSWDLIIETVECKIQKGRDGQSQNTEEVNIKRVMFRDQNRSGLKEEWRVKVFGSKEEKISSIIQGLDGVPLRALKALSLFNLKPYMRVDRHMTGHKRNRIIGRKTFQVKDIRRSYRIRGNVARIQINRKESSSVEEVMAKGERVGPKK